MKITLLCPNMEGEAMNEDKKKTETDRSFREMASMNETLEVLEKEARPCGAKKPRALDVSDIELLCRMLVDLNLKESRKK
jgi:hypothetical protein